MQILGTGFLVKSSTFQGDCRGLPEAGGRERPQWVVDSTGRCNT